jgi:hypothetical protein
MPHYLGECESGFNNCVWSYPHLFFVATETSVEKALKKGLKKNSKILAHNSDRAEVARRVLGVSCLRSRLAALVSAAASTLDASSDCDSNRGGVAVASSPNTAGTNAAAAAPGATSSQLVAAYILHEEAGSHGPGASRVTADIIAAAGGAGVHGKDATSLATCRRQYTEKWMGSTVDAPLLSAIARLDTDAIVWPVALFD